jgi:uncharacterized protein (TIGR02246 family)
MATLSASDRDAIRELMFRYAWHLDHAEWDAWLALFAPDGTWGSEGARPFVGREALAKLAAGLAKRREGAPPTRHFIATGRLQPSEAGARLQTYVMVVAPAAATIKTTGEYDVAFVRDGADWRIHSLIFTPAAEPAPAGKPA